MHQLCSLFGYLLQLLVYFFGLLGIDLIASSSKGGKAIEVNGDHIAIYLVVLLPPYEKLFSHRNATLQLASGLVNNQQ